MNKYFLYLKKDTSDELSSLIFSLIGPVKPILYNDVIIYPYNDYEELMFEEAIKAYMFDLNTFFKCYISKKIEEASIKDNYEMIYKYFILAKKKEIYHEWKLIDEAICLNDLSLKKNF